jgi:hypothetical protein
MCQALSLPAAIELAAQKMARGAKEVMLREAQALFMDRAVELNAALKEGRMSPLIWNVEMRDAVKDLHVAAYVSGKSGRWQDMTQSDWGRVGYNLRGQYAYLRAWAQEVYDLSDTSLEKLNWRAGLYAAAANGSFEMGVASEIGIDTSMLPDWPGSGNTSCLVNCRCRWAIRIISKARGDYDASWRMANAEHCRECRNRSRYWKKLRIRGGVMIDVPRMDGTFVDGKG